VGCFNAQCMISKLPILAGDKVYYIPLSKNGYCDINRVAEQNFTVISVPFLAEYNDYGFIENVDETDVNFVKYLKLMEVDSFEALRKIEFNDSDSDETMNHFFALVHQEVYDNIASLNTRKNETLFMFPRYEPLFRYLNFEVLDNPNKESRKMIRHREDVSISCDGYIDILELAEKIRGSGKVGEETKSKLDNVLRFSALGYLNVAAYNDFMLKNAELKLDYEGDSDEELEDLLGYRSEYLLSQIPGIYRGGTFDDLELAKMSNLISMCHSLHCLFTPSIYHSQAYDYTMHAKVNKIFSNVIKNLIAKRDW